MVRNTPLVRGLAAAATMLVLMLVAASCFPTNDPDLESLGLAIETDIAAGETFEVAVPAPTDAVVTVKTAPAGVTAAITDGPEGMMRLTVNVEFDTPRGAYNLGLAVVRGGEEYLVGWPFEVVEPGGPAPTTGPAMTDDVTMQSELTVESPQPGDLMVSGDIVRGVTSTDVVGYRLVGGGGIVIDEGTLTTVSGRFESAIVFTNTCCIEMDLEVFHVEDGGLIVTVPVTYPEGS